MMALLDAQGREVGLYEVNDAGLEVSTETWSGGSPYFSPTDPAQPNLLAEPVVTTRTQSVQVAPIGSCTSCRTGGSSSDVVNVSSVQPSNLNSDTRIDAGISIGWRELLIILIVAAAARYFELI
jgi:hypothetical protein